MRITYGKNVYGKAEIDSVVAQLKKSTQMGKSVRDFEKGVAKKLLKLVKEKTGKNLVLQKPISPLGSRLLKSLNKIT